MMYYDLLPVSVILGGLLIYFLPTIVGIRKRNALGIFILNLFLGLTGVGWVIALVWAVRRSEKPQIIKEAVQPDANNSL